MKYNTIVLVNIILMTYILIFLVYQFIPLRLLLSFTIDIASVTIDIASVTIDIPN